MKRKPELPRMKRKPKMSAIRLMVPGMYEPLSRYNVTVTVSRGLPGVVLCEGAQFFRADNIHMCMSQPDLFDHHWYIGNLPTVFSGIELSLQMLRHLQV